jgi:hypothetical protein
MDKLKLGYFGDCSITCLISGGKRKLHCTYKDGKERVLYYLSRLKSMIRKATKYYVILFNNESSKVEEPQSYQGNKVEL